MQKEEVAYAKTVVNASYVSRRGPGTCSVRPVHPSRFQKDENSSLKVKQQLVQVAKKERRGTLKKFDRSASIDCGSLSSRIFEYKIDSNRMAEKAFDNSRGYPVELDVIKPLALKPLVLSKSDVSLSQVLCSEIFASGSIPSNKEIDRVLDIIKTVREKNCSEGESVNNYLRFRRHSDVSDLRSSKRRIKDPPYKNNTTHRTKQLSEHDKNFGSTRSAFKSIAPCNKARRQCSQETIPEEDGTDDLTPDEPETPPKPDRPQRLYPVLSPLEDHMPPKLELPPSVMKVDIPEKKQEQLSSEELSSTSSIPSIPATPPDNSLRTTPSPNNETHRSPQLKITVDNQTYVKRRNPFSIGFSVRNPTATARTPSEPTSPTAGHSGNSFSGPEDFVLQHTLMRRARHRHRKCSQPCLGSTMTEDEGVEKLPGSRYSPNTHPRAQHSSTLALCSGNHPPVSYLNFSKRSRSLQVNHIALHEFRNLQIRHENRIKYSEETAQEELTTVTDREASSLEEDTSSNNVSPLPLSEEITSDTSPPKEPEPPNIPYVKEPMFHYQEPTTSDNYSVEEVSYKGRGPKTVSTVPVETTTLNPSSEHTPHQSLGEALPAVRDLDEVKDLFKRVGRKYLTDQCVQPTTNSEIDKRNSLSFVFNGNKELQERVRLFFEQTNKTYCKRLIKQRFASNPMDYTPDSSVVGDLEQGVRPLSEYADVINAHIQSKTFSELNVNLQSYLVKSEDFVSNKCDSFNEQDKLTKSDNFLEKLTASPPPPNIANQPCPTLPPVATSPTLSARAKFSSNNSDASDCLFKSNGSKTSRDSGYGDSTSASNERLHPTKQRNRSASLTILSKLKPLFGLKKRDNLIPDESNPFNKIFEEHPISEFTKSMDNFIARRSSLPNTETRPSLPPDSPYEDIPVFDSPSNNLSPSLPSSSLNTQQAMGHFDSILNSQMQITSLAECEEPSDQASDDDEEFRVSPLPEDQEPEEGDDEVFYPVRKSLEDISAEPCTNQFYPPNDNFSLQDIQEILDSFDVWQQTAPASDKEYHKVHNMLQSKLTIALSSIYHTLINSKIPPNSAQYYAMSTLEDTLEYLDERLDVEEDNANILELVGLLETFEDFVSLHDEVISRRYYDNETLPEMKSTSPSAGTEPVAAANHSIYRMVGLHKNSGEPLGITLKKEEDKVVVHRILSGGMIDRQRLLHIGDVIISINGQDVQPKPDVIQHMLKDQEGDIHLKIIPSYREQAPACQVYVKAHFAYDPKTDNMIPCKEAGLKFNEGDILQIVNQDDPNWWQAKLEGGEGQAGLIPGLILQEQRMASKDNNNDKSSSIGCGGANRRRRRKKKNKKTNYSANKNSEFDQHELNLYEEVAKMPPFNRKTLVLIGAQGVGRRSLISKLVLNEPDKFGNIMPHTSRPIRPGERDGCGYWFTTREKMDEDIANHKYLEFGEYESHLYGTKLDSIRQVMRSGMMCLLDVNPPSLKVLKTPEFVPYIVFIEAPPYETLVQMHKESARDNPNKAFSEADLKKSIEESKRLKRQYSHYFDVIIQNNDMNATYAKLYECISKLSTSPQWVPVSWAY